MAAIKSAARSATVAFGPTDPTVMAMATQDGALDASFSASASLELFKIDLASPNPDLELLSSHPSNEKFNSLSWGTANAGSEEYFYGLIASGQSDGTVCVWNPTPLISKDPNTEASLVAKSQKHAGRVRGLEFNILTPNLLASGGDDGDTFIWDLVNPTSPSHFPALKGAGQDNIVDLSWNRKVQHIMATTSNTGVSVVWDLRRQKSILSFTDPNNRRPCAALEWNPEGATQLIVASADDRSPSLQVWDLRNSISPVKELVGHTKGVVAMAWCPIDSALLLSSAKDYRTVCWDTSSGEIICELPVSSNWNFDVQWSPRIAGVLSTSSYDGRVNLYNIEACSRMLPSEGSFGGTVGAGASSAMRAPKWLKRPCGVTFGFDGKLVSFGLKKGASGSEVNIQTLILEDDLVTPSKEFEAAIEDPNNKSSLQALCEKKAEESRSDEEKEIWSFLKIMFEEQARTSLLSHLGFVLPAPEDSKGEGDENAVEALNTDLTEKLNVQNGHVEAVGEDLGFLGAPDLNGQGEAVDDGADFFNNLSTPKAISPQLMPQVHKEAVEESVVLHEEDNEDGLVEEDDCEKTLRHALVIADFKDAVKQCLSENRMADALILAHVGGPELWEETLKAYFKTHHRPYQKVLAAVVAHDVGNLVNSRPVATWRETLALLCSYAGSQEWTLLCDALAARLDAAGLTQAALLCYICAANTEELARLWYRDVLLKSSSAMFAKEVQDLMEKIVVLALAKGEKRVAPALSRLVGSYAELLASQGVVTAAMDYLGLVAPEESPEDLLILRDRISSAKQEGVRGAYGDVPSGPAIDSRQPPENVFPSYNPQRTTYVSNQQTIYGGSTWAPETPQYTSYPPPAQEPSYSQPVMFLPTLPHVAERLQPPPSTYQSSFAPPPVKPFTPVDPPQAGSFMTPQAGNFMTPQAGNFMTPQAPFSGRGPPLPPQSNQFLPPTQPSMGEHNYLTPFQSAMGPPNIFSGPTNSSTPPPQGFMPVAPRAPLTQQQPGMITPGMQPQSPSSLSPPRAQAVPAMAAPPVTIQTAETANVPADLKPVIATLSRLYNETTEALGGARANPAKKREIDDNSKKLGGLFERLNTSDISPNARAKLIQICQSIDSGDYTTASHLQVSLTTSDWDECGSWLGPLKRMIKLRQTLR
eukprot:c23494_g1_i1 orf=196-3657(+)